MGKNIIHSLLPALAAASCSKEPAASPDEVLTPIRISAVYEGSATTRVAYTEDDSSITATWQADDELYVCYNGHVNTLTLTGGAGTATATFEGTIQGTPSASSVLICFVRDVNNPSAINFNDNGGYTYASGPFASQDGTMAGAAKCNVYSGITTYGTGENISCSFSVNTSMLKLSILAPDGVNVGDAATLTYKTGGTELAKATFTVGEDGINDIYMTVPAGQYTGEQTVTFESGTTVENRTLSATKATFTAGNTYSRTLTYRYIDLSMVDCAGNDREVGKAWTANCYMVHTTGDYKLPLVYGNAIKDGETNAAAYTGVSGQLETFTNHAGNAIIDPWIKNNKGADDNNITVASAELLWQDAEGLVTAVGIKGDYLTVTVGKNAATQEGNALVAAKDEDGTIVWSWHIWVTKQTFANLTTVTTKDVSKHNVHTYQVTNVNLGWVGDPVSRGTNTFYQWGRKDPFPSIGSLPHVTSSDATIAANIKNPTTFYYNGNDGPCKTKYYNMWDAQNTKTENVTTATKKTVYDPCPPGFCVPTSNLYYYLGNYDWENTSWDDTNKGRTWQGIFFPPSGWRNSRDGALYGVGSSGDYWSATPYSFYGELGCYLSIGSSGVGFNHSDRAYGRSVRAVAEE